MIYLQNFIFPSEYSEENYLNEYYSAHVGNTYHTNMYPFRVLPGIGLFRMDFEPITILYGGNGSGKSTSLNVISQKLHIERRSAYNSGELMDAYVGGWNAAQLNERQKNIFNRLIDTEQMNVLETSASLATHFKVGARTICRDLSVLKGFIRHDGPNRGGRRVVIKG